MISVEIEEETFRPASSLAEESREKVEEAEELIKFEEEQGIVNNRATNARASIWQSSRWYGI